MAVMSGSFAASSRSNPAQNTVPEPVSTTQRTDGSAVMSLATWESSSNMVAVIELARSGRLMVTITMPSGRVSTRSVS